MRKTFLAEISDNIAAEIVANPTNGLREIKEIVFTHLSENFHSYSGNTVIDHAHAAIDPKIILDANRSILMQELTESSEQFIQRNTICFIHHDKFEEGIKMECGLIYFRPPMGKNGTVKNFKLCVE